MAEVTMPQLGESVTEGTITKWFKQIGDAIAVDEVLFEVSTDKVDSEVPSPVAGFLTEIRAAEGDTIDVGAVIAVVGDEAPTAGAAPAPASAEAPAPPVPEPAAPATPAAATAVPAASSGGGTVQSPLIRKVLDDAGVDPASVAGTGIGGRITRSDADAAVARAVPAGRSAPSARPAPVAATRGVVLRPAPRGLAGEDVVEPLNNIRRRTGEHMVQSVDAAPHVLTVIEVDIEQIDRIRQAEGAEWLAAEGAPLALVPFVARAVVDALRDFPHLNSSVGDGELVLHHEVNLAIDVDLDFEGMLAPVIRGADGLRMRAIARTVVELERRARAHELSVYDISDGTFSVSDWDAFGTLFMAPIINQPQVAKLAIGSVVRRPVVVVSGDGTEAIAIHSMVTLALSWDHRAVDGAYAAAFLADVRDTLETRDWASEL